MVLCGAAVAVWLAYFSTGRVVGAKTKQVHALDAAAYSGALVQARALNMLAYINRAHIGHQVAMAHLVTLGSWATLGGAQARQAASGNPPAHLIAMLFGARHGAAYLAALKAAGLEHMANTQGQLAAAFAGHDSTVRNILVQVQDDVVGQLPQHRRDAMHAVLRQNYPNWPRDSDFDLRIDQDGWPGFVRLNAPSQNLRPFIEGVSQLYRFLSPRNHTASNTWAVDARCPSRRHQLRRRVATELDAQGRWQSADTESFHALRSNRWIGCYFREYPMGWGWIAGASTAFDGPHSSSPPDDFSSQDFWRWVKGTTDWDIATGDANPLANSRAVAARQRWASGGLAPYYDTASSRAGGGVAFSVTLRHPGPQNLNVSAHSAAETFFERPEPRADLRHESANLFHPYWQARLVAPHSQTGGAP
jgi:hypothetical protein